MALIEKKKTQSRRANPRDPRMCAGAELAVATPRYKSPKGAQLPKGTEQSQECANDDKPLPCVNIHRRLFFIFKCEHGQRRVCFE